MLAIIQLPIPRQNSALGFEAFVKRRIGKRSYDGEPRQINSRLHREFSRLQKDIRPVVVQTEDEASLQRDAMIMQPFDQLHIFSRRIETFVALAKIAW